MAYIYHLCLFADAFLSMWAERKASGNEVLCKKTQWRGETLLPQILDIEGSAGFCLFL